MVWKRKFIGYGLCEENQTHRTTGGLSMKINKKWKKIIVVIVCLVVVLIATEFLWLEYYPRIIHKDLSDLNQCKNLIPDNIGKYLYTDNSTLQSWMGTGYRVSSESRCYKVNNYSHMDWVISGGRVYKDGKTEDPIKDWGIKEIIFIKTDNNNEFYRTDEKAIIESARKDFNYDNKKINPNDPDCEPYKFIIRIHFEETDSFYFQCNVTVFNDNYYYNYYNNENHEIYSEINDESINDILNNQT